MYDICYPVIGIKTNLVDSQGNPRKKPRKNVEAYSVKLPEIVVSMTRTRIPDIPAPVPRTQPQEITA